MIKIKQVEKITPEIEEAFARLIPQLSPNSPIPDGRYLQEIIDSKNCFVFVACNPAIVGSITLVRTSTPSGSKAWIEDVIVDILARKQGISKMLVQHVIDFCFTLNVSSINLTSMPDRVAANNLYKKMGFVLRETNVYRLTMK